MNKKRFFEGTRSSFYVDFIEHQYQLVSQDVDRIENMDLFHRYATIYYHHHFHRKKKQNVKHKRIYFSLSGVFLLLGMIIFCKTTNYSCNSLFIYCGMIKYLMNILCVFLSVLSFGIGCIIKPEKDAIRQVKIKAQRDFDEIPANFVPKALLSECREL